MQLLLCGNYKESAKARDIKSLQYLLAKKYFEAGDERSAARKSVYEVQGTASESSKATLKIKTHFPHQNLPDLLHKGENSSVTLN